MGDCDLCEGDDQISFTCNECGGTYCGRHRLPESHDCDALKADNLRQSLHDDSSQDATRRTETDASPIYNPTVSQNTTDSEASTSAEQSTETTSSHSPDYPDCHVCSTTARYECEHCGAQVCVSHLQPEDHDCPAAPSDESASPALLGWLSNPLSGSDAPKGVRSHLSLRSRLTQHWLLTLVVVVALLGGGLAATGTLDDVQGAVASAVDSNLDEEKTERLVHERVNEVRTERGLEPLAHDPDLRSIASQYSERMASEGFYSHVDPQGNNFEDRYEAAGYQCRVSTGGNQYSTGAENILKTYALTDVETSSGAVSYDSEEELANGIVESWMNSPGHRSILLGQHWENEGVGVEIVDNPDGSGKLVYVTQNFC